MRRALSSGVRQPLIRNLVLCILIAMSVASCASKIPGYTYNRNAACFTPSPEKGQHRVSPSAEDINAIWQLLDLKATDYIHYWYEDRSGNAFIGVTDKTNDWAVELIPSGDTYTVKNPDWRKLAAICVG